MALVSTSSGDTAGAPLGPSVSQEDLGVRGDGAGDGDPLLLPARQLVGPMGDAVGEANQRERKLRLTAPARGRQPGEVQGQLDVLERAQHGNQVERLEDEAHVGVPEATERRSPERRQGHTGHLERAGVRPVDAAEQVQEGALAAPRGTADGDQLPGSDVQIERIHRPDLLGTSAVALHQAPRANDGRAAHGPRRIWSNLISQG
ncbi:hypothetical protein WMF04_30945 [Sorangium sp. So ce260]